MLADPLEVITVEDRDTINAYYLHYLSWLVTFPGGEVYHVTARKLRDGGMIEFYHVDNGGYLGCMGIDTFKDGIKSGEIGLVDGKVGYYEYSG